MRKNASSSEKSYNFSLYFFQEKFIRLCGIQKFHLNLRHILVAMNL